ncbi:hypothetical protein PQR46_27185 [Paraburkholderia sediminicola]|uniref:hypothetical protein n=1 Tax=Paraburkholderia TaxID=1822464 RepID=UPI0038BA67B5
MYTKLGISAEGQMKRQARMDAGLAHLALPASTGNTLSLLDRVMSGKNQTQVHERHFLRTLNRQRFLLPIVQEVDACSGRRR